MTQQDQYLNLVKPFFSPPAWLFGPVWTILYIIIAISFGTVFYKAIKRELAWRVSLPFLLNVVFNLAFTPIQFGLRNNYLASLDILLVLGTLIWALATAWKFPNLKWVALVNIPYLLWTSFATILQLTITWMNR